MTRITKTLFALLLCIFLVGCSGGEAKPEPITFASAPETEFAEDITELSIVLHSGETEILSRLPALEKADFSGSECVDEIYAWAEAHPEVEVIYTVTLPDGSVLDSKAKSADLSKMSGSDVRAAAEVLDCLPKLRSVELGRERSGLVWEDIDVLQQACENANIKYSFTLYGKEIELQNTLLNLSHIPVEDRGEAVRQVIPHMPNLTYVDMDSCGVSNEDMAKLRDEFPDVKIVWRIWFGSNLSYSVRTDAERILASKPSVAGFVDEYNGADLKYCTEVRFLDLGHNAPLADISFVKYMPKLEVAILAMGAWSDASPLASCTELEYLEMQTTRCTDLSPLSGLKNLRHLNIACITNLTDISPLYSLTELERLWLGSNNMVPWEQVEEMQKAAPDCEIDASVYDDPTAGRWRYTADGTWNYRYYILRKQFGDYKNSAFAFTWNDPLY